MPAFTFEKISPPVRRGPIPPIANKKQRGVIVQILDRFVEARVKRVAEGREGRDRPQSAPEPTEIGSSAHLAQQQAAPAFDPQVPQRHQPARAIGGDHAGA